MIHPAQSILHGMEISRQQDGLVKVQGDLHISEVEDLRQALLTELSLGAALELDLSAVDRCDTASLQMLCSLKESATKEGKSLRLSSPSVSMQELCQTLGFPWLELSTAA